MITDALASRTGASPRETSRWACDGTARRMIPAFERPAGSLVGSTVSGRVIPGRWRRFSRHARIWAISFVSRPARTTLRPRLRATTTARAVPKAPAPTTAISPPALMPSPRAARTPPWQPIACRAASGTAARQSADPAGKPSAMRSAPAHAIIEALSVHSRSGGATKRKPDRAHIRPSIPRMAPLAATPPATTRAGSGTSGNSCRNRTSAREMRSSRVATMAAWKDAQMSSTSAWPRGAIASAACRTAVLRPEKEKSSRSSPFSGRGKANRAGSPADAARSTAGPPG